MKRGTERAITDAARTAGHTLTTEQLQTAIDQAHANHQTQLEHGDTEQAEASALMADALTTIRDQRGGRP